MAVDPQDPQEPAPKLSRARRLLQVVQWAGFLGLVAATALIFSARWFWLGEIATSFCWQLGWAGLVGALLLALTRGFRLALFAGLLSLAHLWPELALYLPPEREVTHGTEITIASTNILWHNEDHAAFLDWLDRAAPDLLCIQEISPTWLPILEGRREDYPHALFAPELERWVEGTWGTAILSRIPFEETRLHAVPETDPPERPFMEAVLLLDGRPITFRGAHPLRAGRAWRNERRDRVLQQIAELEWDGAGVALGDFNLTSTSPVFADFLELSGLRDSRAGFGRLPSWRTHQLIPGLWIAIDHILVGEDFVVLERRVDPLPGSDHHLAVARIALRQTPR
jgi:endonuclease/exonuclease/phosphatase (EEP) superfamily protein YafD